jgi:ankyrin repeat protein
MLVEKKDININTCGSWGISLISAIENGQDEVVQCLLEREDCDINIRTVPDGATAIISVCAAQDHQVWHANTLQLLLDKDSSSVNVKDVIGFDALHWVAFRIERMRLVCYFR